MSHSSFRGVVLTLPKLRGSRLAGSGLVDAHKLGACPLMVLAKRRIVSVYTSLAKRRTVWPSTPVCSKFMPALPFWQTMIWSLSYHRLIHVPICTPLTSHKACWRKVQRCWTVQCRGTIQRARYRRYLGILRYSSSHLL